MRRQVKPFVYMAISAAAILVALLYHQALSLPPEPGGDGNDRDADAGNGTIDGWSAVYKNETVYVVLDSTGTVTDQRVVNWIYDSEDSASEHVIDYGCYDSVREMKAGRTPSLVKDEAVIWEQSTLAAGDIFYEGVTRKELPVNIEIAYHLDGEPVEPAALAGRNGSLKITVRLENNLEFEEPVYYTDYEGNRVSRDDTNYVPLLVQCTFTLDLNKYSEIRAADAGKVVIGETMNVSFTAFPYPDSEMVLEMQAEYIELAPIMFTIIPRMPPLPYIDLEDDFVAFLDGVNAMGDGLMQIHDGVQTSIEGLEHYRRRVDAIAGYADPLYKRFKAFSGFVEELLTEIDPDGLIEFLEQLAYWLDLFEQLTGDYEDLLEMIDYLAGILFPVMEEVESLDETAAAMGGDLQKLQTVNDELARHAAVLMEENEPGSELYELGILILSQGETVESLSESGSTLEQGLSALRSRLAGVEDLSDAPGQPGAGSLEEALRQLRQLLEQLNGLNPGKQLDRLGDLLENIENLDDDLARLEELFDELAGMPEAFDQLIDGQKAIAGGIKRVHDEGVLEMQKGLIEAINEMRFGEAKKEMMQWLADDYRSFADNRRNRNSRVQFILQTHRIKPEVIDKERETAVTEEVDLWEKIVNLFRADASE